jgi:hypothetical protein
MGEAKYTGSSSQSAKERNLTSNPKENSSDPNSEVDKVARANPCFRCCKAHYCHSSEAKTITCGPKENRCGNSSKMGTSKGATDKEGCIG